MLKPSKNVNRKGRELKGERFIRSESKTFINTPEQTLT